MTPGVLDASATSETGFSESTVLGASTGVVNSLGDGLVTGFNNGFSSIMELF